MVKEDRRTMRKLAAGNHRFSPAVALPVLINYADGANPFELSQPVVYANGPLKVTMPRGFKCDATSTPPAVFLLPAILQTVAAGLYWHHYDKAAIAFWIVGTALSVLVPIAMPAVGQLGRHARATTIHDVLYRTQTTSRVVADAVCLEIMEYDRVNWIARTTIYYLLRMFGGRAWRKNAKILARAQVPRGIDPGTDCESKLIQ